MSIYRNEMFGWKYRSTVRVSKETAETYARPDSDNEQIETHDTPDLCRGCNLFGEMGRCILKTSIETNDEGESSLVMDCDGQPFTSSRSAAERRSQQCRRTQGMIRDTHQKY